VSTPGRCPLCGGELAAARGRCLACGRAVDRAVSPGDAADAPDRPGLAVPPDAVRPRDVAAAAGIVTGVLLALTGAAWRNLVAYTLVAAGLAYALARLVGIWRS